MFGHVNSRPGSVRSRFAGRALAVLAGWLVVGVGPALAAQRYASPAGTGAACTQVAPCPLPTAVNSAAAGDEVLVEPGSYGTSAAPITTAMNVTAGNVSVHGVDMAPGAPGATIYTNQPYGIQLYGNPGDTISDLTVDDVGSSGGTIAMSGETAD